MEKTASRMISADQSKSSRRHICSKPALLLVMEAELEGELVLENGCLRAKSMNGALTAFSYWPQSFKLSVDGGDTLISDDSGVSLSVGEKIRIGGGELKLACVQTLGGAATSE